MLSLRFIVAVLLLVTTITSTHLVNGFSTITASPPSLSKGRMTTVSSSSTSLYVQSSSSSQEYQEHVDDEQNEEQQRRQHQESSTLSFLSNRKQLLQHVGISAVSVAGIVGTSAGPCYASYIDPSINPPKITHQVYMDVEYFDEEKDDDIMKQRKKGRFIIGLYGEIVPKLVNNFVSLCSNNEYAGTTFYRILSEYSIQGGAINDISGKTGSSSSEFNRQPFEPDNYNIMHTQKGLVSAVRTLNGLVDSRFFIACSDDSGWADDRYAVFGTLVGKGSFQLLSALERVPVKPPKNSPKVDVRIVQSGVLSTAT